jgi:hypothetical protein
MITHHIPFQQMHDTSTWAYWFAQGRPNHMFSRYMTRLGYKIHVYNGGYNIQFEKEEDLTWFLLTL